MRHPVVAILAVIFGSIGIWILAFYATWHIGSWAGGGNVPTAVSVVGFAPSVLDAIVGIAAIIVGAKRRAGAIVTVGVVALAMAAILFMLSGWCIAMTAIG